jgi:hypothetical protein
MQQHWPCAISDTKFHGILRLNAVLLWVTAFVFLVLIICDLRFAPYNAWNDARLAPVAAWLRGFPFYASEHSGIINGNYYPPLGDLAFLPAGLFNHPVPAIIAGSALSLLMSLSAGVGGLLMWSRREKAPFQIVVLGGVLYLGLLLITDGPNYSLFAIHVDAPAIALMLWGVVYYGRWWAYRSTASLAVSAVLFSSVVWAKQLGFPLPVVYCGVTIFIGGTRLAMIFAVWSLATSIFWPLVLAPIITDWHAFFFSIWTLFASHPWVGQFTGDTAERVHLYLLTTTRFFREYWLFYVLGLAVVLALAGPAQTQHRAPRFAFTLAASAFIAAITMLPLSMLGRVKVDGDINELTYTLQPLLFAFVIGGMALIADAEKAGAQWNFVAQSVICACLLLFMLILRPDIEIRSYPLRVSQLPPLLTAYEESKSGDTWFPEFPLSALLATGQLYHHGYSIFAVYLGGFTVSAQQLTEGIPKQRPFKLKYLTGTPEADKLITIMKIPPGEFIQKEVGPWREVLIQKFPPS